MDDTPYVALMMSSMYACYDWFSNYPLFGYSTVIMGFISILLVIYIYHRE